MLDFDNKILTVFSAIIFIGIILLFIFSDFKADAKYNTYIVKVKNVVGVKKNHEVRLGGYPIGFVSDIVMDNKYQPSLILKINKDIKITTDSLVALNNTSLVSSRKDINIRNGVESDYLENNDIINNSSVGLSFDQLLDLAKIRMQK